MPDDRPLTVGDAMRIADGLERIADIAIAAQQYWLADVYKDVASVIRAAFPPATEGDAYQKLQGWNVRPAPQDWPEDWEHENGQYANKCAGCSHVFYGHKHRKLCKVCHSNANNEPAPAAGDVVDRLRKLTTISTPDDIARLNAIDLLERLSRECERKTLAYDEIARDNESLRADLAHAIARAEGADRERDATKKQAERLIIAIAQRCNLGMPAYLEGDLSGLLLQIDNLTSVLIPKERAESAESRLAKAREALEKIKNLPRDETWWGVADAALGETSPNE